MLLRLSGALLLSLSSLAVQAYEAEATVLAMSNMLFRGASLSANGPAAELRYHLTGESGWRLGTQLATEAKREVVDDHEERASGYGYDFIAGWRLGDQEKNLQAYYWFYGSSFEGESWAEVQLHGEYKFVFAEYSFSPDEDHGAGFSQYYDLGLKYEDEHFTVAIQAAAFESDSQDGFYESWLAYRPGEHIELLGRIVKQENIERENDILYAAEIGWIF